LLYKNKKQRKNLNLRQTRGWEHQRKNFEAEASKGE